MKIPLIEIRSGWGSGKCRGPRVLTVVAGVTDGLNGSFASLSLKYFRPFRSFLPPITWRVSLRMSSADNEGR